MERLPAAGDVRRCRHEGRELAPRALWLTYQRRVVAGRHSVAVQRASRRHGHTTRRAQGETAMNFSILGSLEVNVSGRRVAITAPKQRVVLATLLLDINNEVSVNRLVWCVWDGLPPASAQT